MTPLAPIAIIGAGPAGLTLARLLELAQIPYIVFDRDESSTWADEHRSSGTLDIHKASGQVVLREALLLAAFESIARHHVPTKIVDEKAEIHADLSGEANRDKPEIDRKDLRRLLLDSVPASKVVWASKVEHAQKETDGSVSVHFTDGRVEAGFRLVVGADGAWSKVRELVRQNPSPLARRRLFSQLTTVYRSLRPDLVMPDPTS
jgi:2-polyprenyl-6-methoxyphenol hydroxylase-like FAD-dependent oxidoreductase